ncbi:hypothetical protein ACWDR3_45510 [Streptomyces sp. NPDC001002]
MVPPGAPTGRELLAAAAPDTHAVAQEELAVEVTAATTREAQLREAAKALALLDGARILDRHNEALCCDIVLL